ncbi:hypothetical protein PGT21_036326 [Puccinia graminis f. sp. tritici]|uniref:Uncharacterized protein n=1 Tax=Puccinia graminis f. sp. tritici TaxID=56615 RepID=A0A5B0PKQ5_PUCGR|nr:hypothetical protein PGT21_036326 [Puccinia graminis f. sp. tritici]
MAEVEKRRELRTDLVVETLALLHTKYRNSLSDLSSDHEADLTIDEINQKNDLMNQLESSLLPSLKHQTTTLSRSLGLNDLRNHHPDPEPELILRNASNFDEALKEVVYTAEKIILDSPLPAETHDHHFNRCKRFRFSCLRSRLRALVHGNLLNLFGKSIELLRLWQLSNGLSEDSEHQTKISKTKESTLLIVDGSLELIDQIINMLPKSDLALLQEEWPVAAKSLNTVLEFTTLITHPTDGSSQRGDMVDSGGDEKKREDIARWARSTLPLIKLTRLFLHKISKSYTNQLPFTMDKSINSKTLNRLRQAPLIIAQIFKRLLQNLWIDYRSNRVITDQDQIRASFNKLTETLESTLLLLSFYLIPLPHMWEKFPLEESPFKLWFLELTELWHRARDHSLGALSSAGAENEELREQP